MKPRWPFLLAAALLVPGALFGAWGVLTYGGSIEGQIAEERRRAGEALRRFRIGFLASMPNLPRLRVASLVEVDAASLSSAARIGMELEARGAGDEALAYFARVPQPQPWRVVLARARALLAMGRNEQVLELLASAPDGLAVDGVPLALSLAILRAQAGQHDEVWQRAVSGQLQVAPICAAQFVAALRECGAARDAAQVADYLWSARASQALDLGLVEAVGELVPFADGGLWRRKDDVLVSPRGVAAASRQAGMQALRQYGVEVGDGSGEAETLAALDFAGRRWVATMSAGSRGSVRLRQVAATCLASALVAFLLGNLGLLWIARRSAALSRLKTDFIDVVSHELRTPLTALAVKSEMLASGDVPDHKVADYQRTLHQEVGRLSRLVHDVLDFGRLERGRYHLAPRRVPVRDLVAQAVRASRDAVRLGRQRLLIDVPRQLPALFVDVEMLVRALRNLLDNAAKHAPELSGIELVASQSAVGIEFKVRDRGPGLAGIDPKHLFKPFRKGAGGKRGSGLGLAIVDSAVRAHGGRAWASEREGGGAEFCVQLPMRGEGAELG